MPASYLQLHSSGELSRRAKAAMESLSSCRICPHLCGADRIAGKLGFCGSGRDLVISSHTAHHGEEPPVSGTRGSGTVFFTNCNLKCMFCQNYQISHLGEGAPATEQSLAEMMLGLQKIGCHNINWVSPTHFVPQILTALDIACGMGLRLPIVYNTNGYDSLDTLKLLDGIVDIYLPDIKYADDKVAVELSGAMDYATVNRAALKEMHRQVGLLVTDDEGIAQRGIIIRHLVLPDDLSGTNDSLDFIAREISKDAAISLMSQYHPCHQARKHRSLNRKLTQEEYDKAVAHADKLGLENVWIQPLASSDHYLPDFDSDDPFGKKS